MELIIIGGIAFLLFLGKGTSSSTSSAPAPESEKDKKSLEQKAEDLKQKAIKNLELLTGTVAGVGAIGAAGLGVAETAAGAGVSVLETVGIDVLGNPMIDTETTVITTSGSTATTAGGTVAETTTVSSGLLLLSFTVFAVSSYVGQKWYQDYLNSRDAKGDLITARQVINEQFNGNAFNAFIGISQGKISLNMYNRLYNIWRHILNAESKKELLSGGYSNASGWAVEVNLSNLNSEEIPYIRSDVQIYLMQMQSKIDENSVNPFAGMISSNKNEMLFNRIFNNIGFLELRYNQEEKQIRSYYGIPPEIKISQI
jgi:hypothetical protein